MFLKRIEMQGFKSFADKIEMEFDGGVTGIVGPNGSGKSNVSDAVRWVLGEQSAKQLRGGTMTDIIFSGTEKRRPQQFCEVSLVFDNADHALHSDYAEIMVTRRVYRNGEGEYFLNKTACRLKDIVDLFRDTGIGKEGYSIIGQGRIDEILSVRSEDRRAVFEEAAGIGKFKARKIEAERRLEHTAANLTRVQDITDELERSLAPLKAQSETARRFLALSQELKTLELSVFASQYTQYHEKITALEAQISQLQDEAEALSNREARYRQDSARLDGAVAHADALLSEKREQLLTLTQQSEAAVGQVQLLRQQLDQIEAQRAEAQKRASEAAAQLELLTDSNAGALQQRQRVVITGCRQALDQITAQLEEAGRALSQKEAELEAQNEKMIAAMNRLTDVRSAQTRMETMKENLQNRLSQLDSAQAVDLTPFEAGIETARRNAAEAQAALEQVEEKLVQAQKEHQELRDQLTAAFAAQEKTAGAAREVLSRLKLLKQMKQDFEGYNQSVKEVLRYAAAGNSGADVRGVVAGLLRVPKQIERAVEMALGAQAQHIVCASEQDAKAMIEYLRKNRYGRATFLPISTVRGRTLTPNERGALSMPGCLGVASEMISFDEAYRGVAESLLGRTVIAENLDSGIPIMRRYGQSFRLVTLEGDVMNPGGAISGGSTHSRASSLFSREREIDELTQAQERMNARLKEAGRQIETVSAQRERTRAKIASLTEEKQQQQIACARDSERLENAQSRLSQAQQERERSRTEREQVETALKDVENTLVRLTQDTGRSDAGREEAQAAMALLNAQVNDLRAQMEALQGQQGEKRMALSQAEHELDLLVRDETHTQNEQARLTRLIDETKALLNALQARQPQVQDSLAQTQQRQTQLEDQLGACRQELTLLELERTKKVQQQRAVADSLDRLGIQTREQSEKQHRAELNLTRVSGDLKVHCDRIWEDYQLTYAGAREFLTEDFQLDAALKRVDDIRRSIRAMGSVNVGAIEEYRVSSARFDELSTQRADLTRAQEDLQKIIAELEEKMRTQFTAQFTALGQSFSQTFRELFGGGQAQLKLSDERDPLNSGIEIIAQPPGKKLQLMSLLSGGERALTAIAILFAILRLKPSPFCILDEIDAALDEANVDHFARFLANFSRQTQFIVVTHRKGTMACCNSLYGIAMEEKGVSKTVSVRLRDLEDGQASA